MPKQASYDEVEWEWMLALHSGAGVKRKGNQKMSAEIRVIYEDESVLVVYKPAGIATQTARIGQKDMESMLDYIDKLNELDTTGVEPMSHVFPVQNVFREDVVENGDGSSATLANAPESRDNAFVVPVTVEA